MKIRIKFDKQGPIRFIGHLDVMRYFQKVMRRADVDIRYSEGFSPHQIMSFASPLSVGLLSNGEYMDIDVLSTEDSETMIQALNAVSAEGIRVLSYRKLNDSAKNAMSQVAAADYRVWFKEGYEPEDPVSFFKEVLEFCRRDSIPIVKKTKKGEREMDLKPLIYEARVIDSMTDAEGQTHPAIFLKLCSGSTDNVKPELVLGAYYESLGQEYPMFALQVEREDVYADEGTDGAHRFVSLNDYGTDILKGDSLE